MVFFDALKLLPLSLNFRGAGVLEHSHAPSLPLRTWFLLTCLNRLFLSTIALLGLLDDRRGTQGWEVVVAGYVHDFRLLHARPQDVCPVLEGQVLLLEA